MITFLWLIFLIIILEILSIVLVRVLKKDFQWLITSEDEVPHIDSFGFQKFVNHGHDPELGWERKPDTYKQEPIKSVGEERKKYGMTSYYISTNKSRNNPGHENLPNIISSYGDSFAFSRHVNDNETWQWHLSEFTQTNVANFGVGNYGLDQAVLRLKREFPENKTNIVIMMVVPETISRIVNVWKHYSEYGNIFGFKGRYVVRNNRLLWLENPVSEVERFKEIKKYLKIVQENDFCYKNKFQKDLIKYPYTWSILMNSKRNIPLLKALLIKKIYKKYGCYHEKILNKPWEIILKRNFEFSISLYKNQELTDLLYKIVIEYKEYVESYNAIPVFVLVPYLHDIYLFDQKQRYYNDFIEKIRNELLTLDVADRFIEFEKPETLYVNNFYGAHLNNKGNQYLADCIYKLLIKNRILA